MHIFIYLLRRRESMRRPVGPGASSALTVQTCSVRGRAGWAGVCGGVRVAESAL